eukprot:5387862-Pleurochrysis_carterae.AAC.4
MVRWRGIGDPVGSWKTHRPRARPTAGSLPHQSGTTAIASLLRTSCRARSGDPLMLQQHPPGRVRATQTGPQALTRIGTAKMTKLWRIHRATSPETDEVACVHCGVLPTLRLKIMRGRTRILGTRCVTQERNQNPRAHCTSSRAMPLMHIKEDQEPHLLLQRQIQLNRDARRIQATESCGNSVRRLREFAAAWHHSAAIAHRSSRPPSFSLAASMLS